MRATPIVVVVPLGDHFAGMAERAERGLVEAFVPEPPIGLAGRLQPVPTAFSVGQWNARRVPLSVTTRRRPPPSSYRPGSLTFATLSALSLDRVRIAISTTQVGGRWVALWDVGFHRQGGFETTLLSINLLI